MKKIRLHAPEELDSSVSAFFRKNWMVIGVGFAIGLAKAAPRIGAKGGPLLPEYTVKYGAVCAIFFLSGLTLRPRQLAGAVGNLPLHCLVQGFTLGVVPLTTYFCVRPLLRWCGLNRWLLQGIVAVSCMPPPVSSAVILTRAAGGNEAAAIFNSAFGSLLGVLVTPIELLLAVDATGAAGGDVAASSSISVASVLTFASTLMSVFRQLSVTIVLPLAVGQLARPRLEAWLERAKPPLSEIGQCTLLLIIYTTFCDSFGSTSDVAQDRTAMLATALVVLLMQLVLMLAVFFIATSHSRCTRFPPADVVCALFCATHKSLTLGIPVLQIVFADHPFLPMISAPLLMYHPIQIVVGGLLVPTVRDWIERETSKRSSLSSHEDIALV